MKQNDNLDTANPAGMEQFLNEIVIVLLKGINNSISGRLILIESPYLTLQHRDGHISLIRISEVSSITTAPKRGGC